VIALSSELLRSFLPGGILLLPACIWAGLTVPQSSAADLETATDADTQVPSVAVTATTEQITIDGVLDEAIWNTAPKIGDLIQRLPDTGQGPSERTDVILLHDTDNLYIGVVAYDSEPGKVIGTRMERDADLRYEDSLEILLDTFLDKRNAFYFATNPAGAFVDGLAFGSKELNTDWNAIWDLQTRRTDQGWTVEIAIPFKSLNFPAEGDVWGFNIARKIFRKLEEDQWSGARLETEFLQVSEAGEIANMSGLNQGIGLDVRPFVASSVLYTKATDETEFDFEPGLDFFYNITPSLKLTGTINTDFGETEVDARQINLTRFSLFFPEKRSFFLEDIGVFDFASAGPETPGGGPSEGVDVLPFFSRRIGLLDGEEVPIDVGVKLTGKAGSTEIGLLGVQTRETDFVEGKHFLVGRIKQDIFKRSYVGGIYAGGDPAAGQTGRTYGADVSLATSEFLGRPRNFTFNAYGLKSENEGTSGNDLSYGFSAHYPNEIWEGMVVYREIQENFDPRVGFVSRNNLRMYRIGGSYNPRPVDFLNVEQMFHHAYYTRYDRLDNGSLESSELFISVLHWHFKSGDGLHSFFDYFGGVERLFEPFEISPGIVLPVGEYKTDRFRISIGSARKRRLYASLRVTFGDYWSGSAEQVRVRLTYKIPPWFTIDAEARETFAQLPEGDFNARVITSSINFSVSPRLSFSNLIQYDNRSQNLGWQSRMRWTLHPGSDLFVSFNQGWINEGLGDLRFTTADTKLSAKFQYTFRF